MLLQIDDIMTIEEVQDRFNECFPQLKLEFYSRHHKRFAPTDKRFLLDKKLQLGQVRSNHYNGVLEVKSWHTTAKVESELHAIFGLNVQIFRKDILTEWVQTSLSDELTLDQQSKVASGFATF